MLRDREEMLLEKKRLRAAVSFGCGVDEVEHVCRDDDGDEHFESPEGRLCFVCVDMRIYMEDE